MPTTSFVAWEAIVSKAPTTDYSKYQFGNTCITQGIPYFLKYSQSKIFAVEHNFCISEIIRASKFLGRAVSVKISTLRKLSIAKVYENLLDKLIARRGRTADRSRQVLQLGS